MVVQLRKHLNHLFVLPLVAVAAAVAEEADCSLELRPLLLRPAVAAENSNTLFKITCKQVQGKKRAVCRLTGYSIVGRQGRASSTRLSIVLATFDLAAEAAAAAVADLGLRLEVQEVLRL